jgi:hypothetical protein
MNMARKYTLRLRVVALNSFGNLVRAALRLKLKEHVFSYSGETDAADTGVAVYQQALAECKKRNYLINGFDGHNSASLG